MFWKNCYSAEDEKLNFAFSTLLQLAEHISKQTTKHGIHEQMKTVGG